MSTFKWPVLGQFGIVAANIEIGKLFGITYSAVSKAFTRYEERIEQDKKEKRRIIKVMSYVKGWPYFCSSIFVPS